MLSGYLIFFLGIIGLIIRRMSFIYILIAVEIMFLGLNIVFLFLGFFFSLYFLQLVVLVLLVLAACEAAILLSLLYVFYRKFAVTDLLILNLLKY